MRQLSLTEIEQIRTVVNSYLGLMKHYRSYNVKKQLLFNKSNLIFRYGYMQKGLNRFILKKLQEIYG
jgi:hypothetical protein